MSAKRYKVELTLDQRKELEWLAKTGAPKAFTRQRARIWLRADQGPQRLADSDVAVRAVLSASRETVVRARQAWVRERMAQGLRPKPLVHPRRPRRLDGSGEAERFKLACGPAPTGQARWTLALLADQLVTLQVVASIAKQTVRQTLRKTNCSPGGTKRCV